MSVSEWGGGRQITCVNGEIHIVISFISGAVSNLKSMYCIENKKVVNMCNVGNSQKKTWFLMYYIM